ncbi:UBX domain-containing protein, partial [Cephalotus follicularis]
DKYLKTRKIREAEEAAHGSRITKVVIRVRFPDGHTLEVIFPSSETIQSLVDLLREAVSQRELPFYICTLSGPVPALTMIHVSCRGWHSLPITLSN